MTRLLVTGATGFLGSEIARQAIVAGTAVRGLARTSAPAPEGVESAVGDVRDATSLGKALHDCDAIIHAAGLAHDRGRSAADYQSVNVGGTENVVRAAAAAGASRVVLVSSVARRFRRRPKPS